MGDRPQRYCQACGGLDDHPRHVRSRGKAGDGKPTPEFLRSLPPGPVDAVAQVADPTVIIMHMDCCAAAGCAECRATEAENEGRRGQELTDHLTASREA